MMWPVSGPGALPCTTLSFVVKLKWERDLKEDENPSLNLEIAIVLLDELGCVHLHFDIT